MTCLDCDGKGYTYSDPDHKPLWCGRCDGTGEIEEEECQNQSN